MESYDLHMTLWFVNFIAITYVFAIAFIDRITCGAKRRITRTISHKAFRTVSVHHEKIAKTFITTFTSLARNEIIPIAIARTRAKVAFTRKTPARRHQYRTMTLKSA